MSTSEDAATARWWSQAHAAVLDAFALPAALCDAERLEIRHANAAFADLFDADPTGRSVADLAGASLESLRSTLTAGIPAIAGTPTAERLELHWRPLSGSAFPAGILTAVSVNEKDPELAESEARLREIVEISGAVIFVKRAPDFRYILINRRYEEAFGVRREQFLGKTDFDLFPEEMANALRENDERAFASAESLEFEEIVEQADGPHTYLSVKFPLCDAAGRPYAVCGVSTDITDRIEAAAELERLSLDYEQILTFAGEGIYRLDAAGNITFINPHAAKLLGYDPEDLVGRRCHETLHAVRPDGSPYPADECPVLRSLEHGTVITVHEEAFRTASGELVPISLVTAPIRESGRTTGAVCIFRDVSALQRAERERDRLGKRLQQAERLESIGHLAGGIAHDFNNILGAILNFSEFALDSIEPDSPARADIAEVVKAAERASILTKQLLLFSRRQTVELQIIDVNEVVSETQLLLARTLGEHVDLRVRLAGETLLVRIDRSQLAQLLVNLAVNARDAMPAGGRLTVETTLTELDEDYLQAHADLQPGMYARLTVSDSGQGMDADVAARAFEPFFTTKEVGRGTGLGLATAYGVVRHAGGLIQLYSEPGRGTTVKVFLPAVGPAGIPRSAPERSRSDIGRSGVVLIVEDEEAVRRAAARILERAGYTVLSAGLPEQALEVVRAHDGPLSLLLTDVVMPGMSGKELAHAVREILGDLPVLYMSGYTQEVVDQQGELDGPLLDKPFTAAHLLDAVGAMLHLNDEETP